MRRRLITRELERILQEKGSVIAPALNGQFHRRMQKITPDHGRWGQELITRMVVAQNPGSS